MQASTHSVHVCAYIHKGTLTGEWRSRRNGLGDRLELPAVYMRAYLSLSLRLESFYPQILLNFLPVSKSFVFFVLEMVTRDL